MSTLCTRSSSRYVKKIFAILLFFAIFLPFLFLPMTHKCPANTVPEKQWRPIHLFSDRLPLVLINLIESFLLLKRGSIYALEYQKHKVVGYLLIQDCFQISNGDLYYSGQQVEDYCCMDTDRIMWSYYPCKPIRFLHGIPVYVFQYTPCNNTIGYINDQDCYVIVLSEKEKAQLYAFQKTCKTHLICPPSALDQVM